MGSPSQPENVDRATVEYFDAHQHKYSHARIKGVAELVRGLRKALGYADLFVSKADSTLVVRRPASALE